MEDAEGEALPRPARILPVRLTAEPGPVDHAAPILEAVGRAAGDVPALLALARTAGREWPRPGKGGTGLLWELLASVAAVDVGAARVFEPHLDALAILSQAGRDPGMVEGAWGVFAAEGPGTRLTAGRSGAAVVLNGAKPWCSLASMLDHAVVTAHTSDGGRAAFSVNLRHPGVTCEDPAWVARGLQEIPSGTVHFDHVPAEQVQDTDWYFKRPGFAWGGMGVAACWLGGAVGVARDYRDSLRAMEQGGREPDQIALASLGEVDRILTSALQCLSQVATAIDHGNRVRGEGVSPWGDALRVRGTCAAAVERVLSLVSRNRGPGPLAFDQSYAKRMADLALYVRQHHYMRDDAQLGALTLKGAAAW